MGPAFTRHADCGTRGQTARLPGHGMLRGERTRQAAEGVAAFAALAVLAAQARGGPLGRLDRKLPRVLQGRRTSAGIAAARAVSGLAEPEFIGALLVASAVARWRRGRWWAACAPCVVVPAGAFARRRLSRVIRRERPPEPCWLIKPEGFSLPSKHTTLAVLTAGALISSARGSSRTGQAAPFLTAAVVGASRVYLGVHWPTDILAGWLFAEGWIRLARSATWAEGHIRPSRPAGGR